METPVLSIGEPEYPGDGTVRMVRRPVPPDVAQDIIDFLFEKKFWHEDVNLVHAKVRQWKQRIRAAKSAPPLATAPGTPSWEARAFELRHPAIGEPMSWQKVAETVGQPKTTVRRVVAQIEAAQTALVAT